MGDKYYGLSKKEFKQGLKLANEKSNLYYEEYKECQKSWLWGSIVSGAITILITVLICMNGDGFQWEAVFLGSIIFIGFALVAVPAFALKFTSDFGASCIVTFGVPLIEGLFSFGFSGCLVTIPVAICLLLLLFVLMSIPFVIFMMIFPLETLYYAIRYSIEKSSVKKDYIAFLKGENEYAQSFVENI